MKTILAAALVFGVAWLELPECALSEETAAPETRTDRYGDPLPPQALVRLGTVRLRHGGIGGTFVRFTADGKSLISGSEDGFIHFWDPVTGRRVRGVRTEQWIHNVEAAISSDEKLLVSASLKVDPALHVCDLATGKVLKRFGAHDQNFFNCVAFAPDGKTVASGSYDNRVRLWDWSSGRELRQFKHGSGVMQVAFTSDGRALVAKVIAGEIHVWETATGKELHRFESLPGGGRFALSAHGQTLAVETSEAIALFDIATGRKRRQLRGGERGALAFSGERGALAFSLDGKLLSSAEGKRTRLWDVSSGKEIAKLEGVFGSSLAFSPNGKMFATGTMTLIQLWDLSTGKELHRRDAHEGEIGSMAFSGNGTTLATSGRADNHYAVCLWDVATGQRLGVQKQASDVYHCRLSRDGKAVFVAELDNAVSMWEAATGREIRRFLIKEQAKKYENQVFAIALSPDGKTLSSISQRSANSETTAILVAWDVATGKEVRKWERPQGDRLAFSPDGRLLAMLSRSSAIILDAGTGQIIRQLEGEFDSFFQFAFAPEGKVVAGICVKRLPLPGYQWKYTIVLWEVATGRQIQRLEPKGRGWTFAFSPDGRLLAYGPAVREPIQLWDLATGQAGSGRWPEQHHDGRRHGHGHAGLHRPRASAGIAHRRYPGRSV